jgi:hypothetical protein
MLRTSIALLLSAVTLQADEQTARLATRLAEEAAVFEREAPRLIGTETLTQRAIQPPRRFRLRVGQAARRPAEPDWQTRTVVSEYGFGVFADGSLHELRQVRSVDGKPVKTAGAEALARSILASGDQRKREFLRALERHGLRGAVTDFGPLLLLFQPSAIARYEFSFLRQEVLNDVGVHVFSYQQLDGPRGVTILDAQGPAPQSRPAQGEVWVTAGSYTPVRITLRVDLPRGARQEAQVDYAPSPFAVLLPTGTRHREFREGLLQAQNDFVYSGFHRFGASASIRFNDAAREPR